MLGFDGFVIRRINMLDVLFVQFQQIIDLVFHCDCGAFHASGNDVVRNMVLNLARPNDLTCGH